MNPCHDGRTAVDGWRQCDAVLMETACGVVKVQLVEDAVLIVAGQHGEVLAQEFVALLEESSEVGTLGQCIAVDGVVNVVVPHLVVFVAHGCNVYAFARLQLDLPVVSWHAGNDVVVCQLPTLSHV